MTVEELLSRLEASGIRLTADGGDRLCYRGRLAPSLRALVAEHKSALIAHLSRLGAPDRASGDTFPMTPLQEAYWIAETGDYALSAPAHIVQEFTVAPPCSIERLRQAFGALLQRHEMARVRILADGRQEVPASPAALPFFVDDLRDLSAEEAVAAAARVRASLRERLPPLSQGPPLLCAVLLLPAGEIRALFAFRLFAFDGFSVGRFFAELQQLYDGLELEPEEPGGFRRFVLARRRGSEARREAAGWASCLDQLPSAPDLPIAPLPSHGTGLAFDRCDGRLERPEWERFQATARRFEVTPTAALCALYSDTLRRWCRGGDITLNVMISWRDGRDERFVGNASSTILLPTSAGSRSFGERARETQRRLLAGVATGAVSGVELIRELQKRHGGGDRRPLMPIVFSSFLGQESRPNAVTEPLRGWRLTGGTMVTPQVYLDHQVFIADGTLAFNFDHVRGLFPTNLVEDMVNYYTSSLKALSNDDAAWTSHASRPLPARQRLERDLANGTEQALAQGALHDFFLRQAAEAPSRTAVAAPDASLTYRELDTLSADMAKRLVGSGVRPGDRVGVHIAKSSAQIVAVVGILRLGATYVPLDKQLPSARLRQIVEQAGLRAIVDENGVQGLRPSAERETAVATSGPPGGSRGGRVAYVIFTSGSTGQPKGVVITHDAAVNTIQDLIHRFALGRTDRILAVSALGFDLSVFDIFAALAVGGTIVMPPASTPPEPRLLADWSERHRVTIWNSVPALMEMVLDHLEEEAGSEAALASLRLIMLSGDWVRPGLAERVRRACPRARLFALGGATEAAIWSNCHEVETVDRDLPSVPYGKPLANQRMHVLNADLEDSPEWVPGDLYIAGAGLALGYLNMPDVTAKSFITHPRSGERLYRTGDLARYRPGGVLEFLGREDSQVKLRGFRIELAEIDAALARHPAVERSVTVLARNQDGTAHALVSFVVADPAAEPDTDGLKRHVARLLPDYMVPARVEFVAGFPTSANGKVDVGALARSATGLPPRDGPRRPAMADEVTSRLQAIWLEALGLATVRCDEDFFQAGGDSLLAARVMRRIEREFGISLSLASLLQNNTIDTQAALVRRLRNGPALGGGDGASALVTLRLEPEAPIVCLVHPVGGGVLCYRDLAEGLRGRAVVAFQQPEPAFDNAAGSLRDMAGGYAEELLRTGRPSPKVLAGWSMGGVLALEIACALEAAGQRPPAVTLIDSWVAVPDADVPDDFALFRWFLHDGAHRSPGDGGGAAALPSRGDGRVRPGHEDVVDFRFRTFVTNYRALLRHEVRTPKAGGVTFLTARTVPEPFPELIPFADHVMRHGWPTAGERIEGDHFSIMTLPDCRPVIDHLLRASEA